MQILKSPVRLLAKEPFSAGGVNIPAGEHKGYRVPSLGEYFIRAWYGVDELDEKAGDFSGSAVNVTEAVNNGLLKLL